jgi:hypothetical protein
MKSVIIIILFLVPNLLYSNKIFIVETNKSIDEILLINSKTGKENKLVSKQIDNTNFSFEATDLEGLFLKVKQTAYLKIYSVNDKISSSWHKIEQDEAVEVKFFFQENTFQNVELKDFYIKNLNSNPLTVSKSKLRTLNEEFFYTPQNFNFIKPENFNIKWKSGYEIQRLEIIEDLNSKSIFSTQNYTDTVLSFETFKTQNVFQTDKSYSLVLNTLDKKNNAMNVFTTPFFFSSFFFKNNQTLFHFLTPSELFFEWGELPNSVSISIYNYKNERVFFKENYEANFFSIQQLINSDIIFEKRKKYTIFIQNKDKKLYADFYFLLNKE